MKSNFCCSNILNRN